METKEILAKGIDSFTPSDLFRKVAQYKGLKFHEERLGTCYEPIKTYMLNEKLLVFLAERGIKRQDRSDCNNKIFTIVDENPQDKVPGYAPSNYWNFDLLKDNVHKFDLRVFLKIDFEINIKERGVILWPQVRGPFVSANDRVPNLRMFKALVENDKDAPAIAKELAASDGKIIITWTDINLGGLCNVPDLFAEFAGQNEVIKEISEKLAVFYPSPNGNKLFVAETAQPRIFQAWRRQLNVLILKLLA